MKLILTCEHGGNHIPKKYKSYFKENQSILSTHKGFDLGALNLFKALKPLSDYSNFSTTSRLLIELNRSLHHRNLFSEYSKPIPKAEKSILINQYYLPYRNEVEQAIKKFIEMEKQVLHISVHTFTPIINTVERNCDIGLLFNSSNSAEKGFCKQMKSEIKRLNPNLKTRYNYPYLGRADGFTTYLRKRFPENYLGIELEVNQKFSKNNKLDSSIKQSLFEALGQLI